MKPKPLIKSLAASAAGATLLGLLAATAQAQNGTWTSLVNGSGSGSWAAAANWNNGIIASGANNTADFSTLDITTNSIVTLDGAQTIGSLLFGDTTPGYNWTLNSGTGGPLTLSASAPVITVNNGTATIGAVIANANNNGFTKEGGGTLVLSAANTFPNDSSGDNNLVVAAGQLATGKSSGFGVAASGSPGFIYATNGGTIGLLDGANLANICAVIAGAGAGGTNGALYSNVGTDHNQYGAVYWSYGLTTPSQPAILLAGDATIRIDGDGISFVLAGAIGNVNGTESYTLTKTGGSGLYVDPNYADIQAAVIHVEQGLFVINGANQLAGAQTVIVDPGALVSTHRPNGYNSSTTAFVVNGSLDLNGNTGAGGSSWWQKIGTLAGSGCLTNAAAATQTLYVEGLDTNGVPTDDVFNGSQVGGGINLVWENGGGTLTLNGGSHVLGGVNATAGNLVVNGTNGLGYNFALTSGGTLSGTGTIAGTIGLTNGSTLIAGSASLSGGTMVAGSIVDDGSGTIEVEGGSQLLASGQIGAAGGYFGTLTLSGGTLQVGIPVSGGAAAYVSTLNASGANVLTFTSVNPAIGQFPLIAYSTFNGAIGNFSLAVPAGYAAQLLNNAANSSIDVVITSAPATGGLRIWSGAANNLWDTSSADWVKTNGSAAQYANINGVLFNDTATGSTNVDIAAAVAPVSLTVSNNADSYTFSGSSIVGSEGLTKSGTGLLTLDNANGYTGPTVVNAGTLCLGNASAIASSAYGTVSNGATVVVGPGLWINNYVPLILNGTGVGGTNGALYANVGPSGYPWGANSYNYDLTSQSTPAISLAGDSTIRIDGGPNPLANACLLVGWIEGNGHQLTKTGYGELRVDPSGSSSAGSLDVTSIHVAQGSLGLNGSYTLATGQTLTMDSGTYVGCHRQGALESDTAVLVLNGTLDLQANTEASFSQQIGSLSGSGIITETYSLIGTQTLSIAGQDTGGNIVPSTFNGSIVGTASTASINVVADNVNSVLHLNGSNSFTGTVTAQGGLVFANGWNSTGATFAATLDNASNPGTIAGTGVISGTVILAGGTTLGVGDPLGVGGTLTVGTVVDEADDATVAVTTGTLAVTGSLGASSAYVGTLNLTGGGLQLPLPGGATAGAYATAFNVAGANTLSFTTPNPVVGQFPLIAYSTLGGGAGFSGLTLSAPAGVTAHLVDNTANNSVDVAVTAVVNTAATNLIATVSGSRLTLTWPADHTGWHLQVQTNSLAAGLGTNWVTIPDSNLNHSYTGAIAATNGAVFYRMVYP